MVDVEMKEANAATEEKKGDEAPDKKEPTDQFYGRYRSGAITTRFF